MDGNKSWISPHIEGISLREYYKYISEMVKAKTGRAMQTILAKTLGMERGTSEELTGRKHLERTDYIVAKQKQEAEKARIAKERNEAIRLLDEQKANERQRIDRAVREATGQQHEIIGELRWKSALLNALADLLYRAGGVFRRAVSAIISFTSSQYKCKVVAIFTL